MEFKINKYTFVQDNPFEDLVTKEYPFYHFQILKPKDVEQRQKAIDYFNEHKKLFVAWMNCPDIILFIGATKYIYIRSESCGELDGEQLKKTLDAAANWYRFESGVARIDYEK